MAGGPLRIPNIAYGAPEQRRLRFVGWSCRSRLECERELLAMFRRSRGSERAQFFIISWATRHVQALHPSYICNLEWLAANLRADQQDYREGAWLDRKRLPLTLTVRHREHLALNLARSLACSLLEEPEELTPQTVRQELIANWPHYRAFAGLPRRIRPEIQKRFDALVTASCDTVQRKPLPS